MMNDISLTAWPTPPPGMARPDRVIPCDICGSDQHIELWAKKDHPQSVRTVICKDCGLVFTNPQPDVVYSVGSYYRKDRLFGFRQRYLELIKAHLVHEPMAARWIQLLDIKKKSRVLDVGCGSTGIGGRIAEITGAKVTGIDPDPYAIEYCKQNFPMAEYINVSWQDYEAEPYDVIFLNQVLEHQPSPRNCLMRLRGLLRGKLGIAVPCLDFPDGSYYGDTAPDASGLDLVFRKNHLYSYSVKSLTNLLMTCGYKVLEGKFGNDGGKQETTLQFVAEEHWTAIHLSKYRSFSYFKEDAEQVRQKLLEWHESRAE